LLKLKLNGLIFAKIYKEKLKKLKAYPYESVNWLLNVFVYETNA